MNIQRINNNNSFSSRIIITNNTRFFQEALNRNSPQFVMGEIKAGKHLWTHSLQTCIGGGSNNPHLKEGNLFHYLFTSEEALRDFYRKTQALQQNNTQPNILIIGGNSQVTNSESIFNKTLYAIREFRNNVSFIYGQNDFGKTDAIYDGENDTWVLMHKFFEGIPCEITSLDVLRKIYKWVRIAGTDTVEFFNH